MKQLNFGSETVDVYKLHLTHLNVNYYIHGIGGSLKSFKINRKLIHQHYDSSIPTFDDDFKFKLAKYYIFTRSFSHAYQILEELANQSNYKHEVYILYLKAYHMLQVYDNSITDVELKLMDAASKLTNQEWCDLFMGPCNVNFEIFEYQPLKNMYCEKCRQ